MVLRAALAVFVSASCGGRDEASGDATTGAEGMTSEGGGIELEQCDELLTQVDCEAAVIGQDLKEKCAWFDVRFPGASCSDTTVVPQCVGMGYVGAGCQPSCARPDGTSADGFYRMVDGQIGVLENPSTECGMVANVDGWLPCFASDLPECGCLCSM
jgi:hypothetical protein